MKDNSLKITHWLTGVDIVMDYVYDKLRGWALNCAVCDDIIPDWHSFDHFYHFHPEVTMDEYNSIRHRLQRASFSKGQQNKSKESVRGLQKASLKVSHWLTGQDIVKDFKQSKNVGLEFCCVGCGEIIPDRDFIKHFHDNHPEMTVDEYKSIQILKMKENSLKVTDWLAGVDIVMDYMFCVSKLYIEFDCAICEVTAPDGSLSRHFNCKNHREVTVDGYKSIRQRLQRATFSKSQENESNETVRGLQKTSLTVMRWLTGEHIVKDFIYSENVGLGFCCACCGELIPDRDLIKHFHDNHPEMTVDEYKSIRSQKRASLSASQNQWYLESHLCRIEKASISKSQENKSNGSNRRPQKGTLPFAKSDVGYKCNDSEERASELKLNDDHRSKNQPCVSCEEDTCYGNYYLDALKYNQMYGTSSDWLLLVDQRYMCFECGENIGYEDLDRHRNIYHRDVPLEEKMFVKLEFIDGKYCIDKLILE